MNIIIGSKNKTKIKAVETVFSNYQVLAFDAQSGVSDQPIGDEETREGAVNRASVAQNSLSGSIGIGLEGGVMDVAGKLFLCNWGALMIPDGRLYTAAGARIELPDSFKEKIDDGQELSTIMNTYTKREDIRNHEGAIGIFTADLVDRASMFVHVVTLLKGQMTYWQHKKGS